MGDGVVILLEAGGRLGFPESLVARRTRMEGRSSGQPTRPSFRLPQDHPNPVAP